MLCFFGGFKSIWILSVGQCQRTLGGPTQSRRGPLFVEEPDYPISPRKKTRNIFFLNCILFQFVLMVFSLYLAGPQRKSRNTGSRRKTGLVRTSGGGCKCREAARRLSCSLRMAQQHDSESPFLIRFFLNNVCNYCSGTCKVMTCIFSPGSDGSWWSPWEGRTCRRGSKSVLLAVDTL